jgi:hypothetical protein
MRRYVFRLAMLTLAAFGPGVARGDDQKIAEQIVQKLQAEKQAGTLKGFSIDLQVDEGTVWLSGRVANADQQAKALDIARRVPGVVQVVNDLSITAPASTARTLANPFTTVGKALAGSRSEPTVPPVAVQPVVTAEASPAPIGSGVDPAADYGSSGVVQAAQPIANLQPQPAPMAQPVLPQAAAPASLAQAAPGQLPQYALVPVYAGSRQQVPLAFAPAQAVNYAGPVEGGAGAPGAPVPAYLPGSGVGIAPARYDHPTMPGYAWPSYAAYPNYAAVTYPKQYSPAAWPYIGPFYPYPQVPLGWRKVTLEWDDGWWMLDFKDRRTMYNH